MFSSTDAPSPRCQSKSSIFQKFLLQASGVALLVSLLHLALSWPLVLHFTSAIPGALGDGVYFYWQIWFAQFNATEWHGSWVISDLMFYPNGILYPVRPLLIWYAVGSFCGRFIYDNPIFWFNTILVFSSVATALGIWVLARRITGHGAAALLASILFTFSQRRFELIAGHINFFSTEILIWGMVAMHAAIQPRSTWRPWIAAGILWAMQIYQSPNISIMFGVAWMVFAVWVIVRHWRCRQGSAGRLIFPLIPSILAAMAAAPLVLSVLPHLQSMPSGEVPWPQTRWVDLLAPSFRQEIYRPIRHLINLMVSNPLEQREPAFIGYAIMAGGLVWLFGKGWREKTLRPWLLLAAVTFILVLGRSKSFLGLFQVPLPYGLFQHLPVLREFRVPSRFNTLLMIPLSLMAAQGWMLWRSRKWPLSKILWGALVVLGLLDAFFVPIDITIIRGNEAIIPSRLLEIIRQDPQRDISVLSLPGPQPPLLVAARSLVQQTYHHHPIYDGFETRWSKEIIDSQLLGPLAFIREKMGNGQPQMQPDEFRERIAPARIKYLLFSAHDNPHASFHRQLITRYFPVISLQREGEWTLYNLSLGKEDRPINKTGENAPRSLKVSFEQ